MVYGLDQGALVFANVLVPADALKRLVAIEY